jgi:membrane protease YdiL (CAAX protease family)
MARKRGGEALFWTILLWVDIALLCLLTVVGIIEGILLLTDPNSEYAKQTAERIQQGDSWMLYLNMLLTFALFAVVPFLWIWRTRLGGWPAAKEYLSLRQPIRSLGLGIAFGLGLVVAIFILLTIADTVSCNVTGRQLGETEGPNPVTDAISNHLDWGTILLIALVAGIGEEILFRGLVQRQLGMWWQAILFSVAHAANASILQLVITLPIGILFGWWIRRGGSLYTTIAAHFTYDFVILAIALYGAQHPELLTEGC